MVIGESIPLILEGHLIRKADDVNIVDEVPAELRSQHQLLGESEQV
jgi:hypothetical protein